jgi:hypothetical protein
MKKTGGTSCVTHKRARQPSFFLFVEARSPPLSNVGEWIAGIKDHAFLKEQARNVELPSISGKE